MLRGGERGFELESGLFQGLADNAAWKVPTAGATWSHERRRAAWTRDGRLVVFDARHELSGQTFVALATETAARSQRMAADGSSVKFLLVEDLYEYRLDPCPGDRQQRAPDLELVPTERQGWDSAAEPERSFSEI